MNLDEAMKLYKGNFVQFNAQGKSITEFFNKAAQHNQLLDYVNPEGTYKVLSVRPRTKSEETKVDRILVELSNGNTYSAEYLTKVAGSEQYDNPRLTAECWEIVSQRPPTFIKTNRYSEQEDYFAQLE